MTSTRTACEGTPARRKRRRPAVQLPRCGTAWFVSLLLLATTNSLGAQTNPEQQSPTPPSAAEQPTSSQPGGSQDPLPDNLPDKVSAQMSSDPGVRALAGISQSISQNPSLHPSLQTAITFATLAIVPIVLLMTTGYIRMAVVLGLLRQGFGAASAPPPQVTTALAVFLTVLVMMPVWQQVKRDALDPYLASENPISLTQAVEHGVQPIKHLSVSS